VNDHLFGYITKSSKKTLLRVLSFVEVKTKRPPHTLQLKCRITPEIVSFTRIRSSLNPIPIKPTAGGFIYSNLIFIFPYDPHGRRVLWEKNSKMWGRFQNGRGK
jgi:hypothetical protein